MKTHFHLSEALHFFYKTLDIEVSVSCQRYLVTECIVPGNHSNQVQLLSEYTYNTSVIQLRKIRPMLTSAVARVSFLNLVCTMEGTTVHLKGKEV